MHRTEDKSVSVLADVVADFSSGSGVTNLLYYLYFTLQESFKAERVDKP